MQLTIRMKLTVRMKLKEQCGEIHKKKKINNLKI